MEASVATVITAMRCGVAERCWAPAEENSALAFIAPGIAPGIAGGIAGGLNQLLMTALIHLHALIELSYGEEPRNHHKGIDKKPSDSKEACTQARRDEREHKTCDPVRVEQSEWSEHQI